MFPSYHMIDRTSLEEVKKVDSSESYRAKLANCCESCAATISHDYPTFCTRTLSALAVASALTEIAEQDLLIPLVTSMQYSQYSIEPPAVG